MLNLINMLGYTFIMSITPGPNNVICLTQGTKFGFRRSLPYIYGVAIGCMSMEWLLLFLGSVLGDALPSIARFVGFIGAGYMVWLAIKMLRTPKAMKGTEAAENPLGFLTGVVFQYANPKAYVFCTTIISGFILPMNLTMPQNFMITLMTGVVFLLCTSAWILFGQAFTKLFSRYHRLVSYSLAATLVYLAASIVLHI